MPEKATLNLTGMQGAFAQDSVKAWKCRGHTELDYDLLASSSSLCSEFLLSAVDISCTRQVSHL